MGLHQPALTLSHRTPLLTTRPPNPCFVPCSYTFRNPDPDCVLRKGRRHCLVLKPAVSRIDESEDLAEVAREYETQLVANR